MTARPAPKWLRREAVLILHDESLADHGGAAGIRDGGLFESALARPENLFAYGEPDLFDLAAAYAFGIVRNHPFVDGNKRTGFLAAAVFLEINGWVLIADEVDATVQTFGLAASEISEEIYAGWLRRSCEKV
ncbi:type II toxin-antitoxin system death-on-curing family toxin [Hyphomonas sp. WL0036]|uniref:type II toxin-antitoxin system death-on-curing family toxin n=1 Tax=Hyphomonas sediminis TaxID=2866160 RepID=UPI001C7F48D1|nr:type II toxin-antitoxin system death-on-curing family toxin [Hyphomonas sediminis]MBY9065672.1 type II toxin-antitoxin system death-on-curing family toxin [Hyphomonas sediminis]